MYFFFFFMWRLDSLVLPKEFFWIHNIWWFPTWDQMKWKFGEERNLKITDGEMREIWWGKVYFFMWMYFEEEKFSTKTCRYDVKYSLKRVDDVSIFLVNFWWNIVQWVFGNLEALKFLRFYVMILLILACWWSDLLEN